MICVGDATAACGANVIILRDFDVFLVDFDVTGALIIGHSVAESGEARLGWGGMEIVPVVFGGSAGEPLLNFEAIDAVLRFELVIKVLNVALVAEHFAGAEAVVRIPDVGELVNGGVFGNLAGAGVKLKVDKFGFARTIGEAVSERVLIVGVGGHNEGF